MRIYLKLSEVLPILLVSVLALTSQAQTQLDGSQTGNRANELIQAVTLVQDFAIDDSSIPETDDSTLPRKFAPSVNSAAFAVPVSRQAASTTPTPAVQSREESGFFNGPPASDLTRSVFQPESYYAPDSQSTFQPAEPQFNRASTEPTVTQARAAYGQGAIALGSATSFQRSYGPSTFMPNPFGADESESCDEWKCFARCGGLKANPGHLGLPWLRSMDDCDVTEPCRKHGKRHCKSADGAEGCQSNQCGGDECSANPTKRGILAHVKNKHGKKAAKRTDSCDCSECKSSENAGW